MRKLTDIAKELIELRKAGATEEELWELETEFNNSKYEVDELIDHCMDVDNILNSCVKELIKFRKAGIIKEDLWELEAELNNSKYEVDELIDNCMNMDKIIQSCVKELLTEQIKAINLHMKYLGTYME